MEEYKIEKNIPPPKGLRIKAAWAGDFASKMVIGDSVEMHYLDANPLMVALRIKYGKGAYASKHVGIRADGGWRRVWRIN
jgi:hypothetical protein